MAEVRCPRCDEGWMIVNPDWPRGTEPYRERCDECGGTGVIEVADGAVDDG